MPISVVIADDQEMVRRGFRMILEATDGIDVLADVADGEAALAAARTHHPDVMLLDIRMPEMDGLEVNRRLRQDTEQQNHEQTTRVVIVTTFHDDEYVQTALHDGVSGFLLKDASPALLVEAVKAAAEGDSLISPAITVRLLQDMAARPGKHRPPTPEEPLTPREIEVTCRVAKGLTNAEIAQDLYLSLSTVKAHLTHIQTKLTARNRVEIASWAWETGLCTE
ncbi:MULTISPECIES: response regulator transcription factor [unclassified Streptomyces]|uniref:response regulator transcription factor n=1 Tax=unclassified Streptomyces TaxID=2593676 RepID=UPI0033E37120